MRRFGLIFLGLATAILCSAGQNYVSGATNPGKIGYVDIGKVFDEYGKTKAEEDGLEKIKKEKDTRIDEMEKEIKKMKDELVLLSDKKKEEKQSDIDKKIKSLNEYRKGVIDDLTKLKDEKIRDIIKEIEKVIQEYGENEGYNLIINDRVLLYKDKGYDLTEKIIKILNDGYKK